MRPAGVAAVVLLVAAPFLLVGLGGAALDDPGEGMHAEIARELSASRDPFALTLSGVRYVDKPPLLYVLIALTTAALGQGELAARLPSAVAALVAVGVTAWFGSRLLGLAGGALAGLALLTSIGFFAYGRYVRPEALLVAVLIGGFALTLTGIAADHRGRVIAGLVVFGMAGLAKDPIAALTPPLAIGAALALNRRLSPVSRWLPVAGVAGGLAVALGWWALAEVRTRGFVWYTVVDNHLLNVVRARHFPDEDVPLTAIEFVVVAACGAAPWIIGAGATIVDLVRRKAWRDPGETAWIALALWATGVLGLTALSPFRLPHYGLPAYPMLALLAARAWCSPAARWLAPAHAIGFAGIGLGATIVWQRGVADLIARIFGTTDVATRKSVATGAASPLPPWESFAPLIGWTAVVCGAAALALVAVSIVRRTSPVLAAFVVALAMLAILPAVASGLAIVSSYRAVKPLAIAVRDRWRGGDVLVHEGPMENSGALEWYSGRRPVLVDGRRSVLGFGATRADAARAFWDADRLATAWRGADRVWLVTTRDQATTLASRLPGARLVAASGGRRLYVNHGE